jgi:hypothetical protein
LVFSGGDSKPNYSSDDAYADAYADALADIEADNQ